MLERESAHVNERERERELRADRRRRHRSGSDSAAGWPACSALCSHVRPMLLGAGLCGAGRAHAPRRWMERRRARTRVGGSRVACIWVCAVSARAVRAREREPCEITLQCCRSQPRSLLRCSAAAEYQRGRALLPLAARRSTGNCSNQFQLLGDTGATFVGTYYCVPLTHGTKCEYQLFVFLYRIVFMSRHTGETETLPVPPVCMKNREML
jgi:hypothetical protein